MSGAHATAGMVLLIALRSSDAARERCCAPRRAARASGRSDADDLYAKLLEREQLGSTAIGGDRDPALQAAGLERGGRGRRGPERVGSARRRQPVRLFFLVVSPESSPAEHLQILAAISRWLKDDGNLERSAAAATRSAPVCSGAWRGERG